MKKEKKQLSATDCQMAVIWWPGVFRSKEGNVIQLIKGELERTGSSSLTEISLQGRVRLTGDVLLMFIERKKEKQMRSCCLISPRGGHVLVSEAFVRAVNHWKTIRTREGIALGSLIQICSKNSPVSFGYTLKSLSCILFALAAQIIPDFPG